MEEKKYNTKIILKSASGRVYKDVSGIRFEIVRCSDPLPIIEIWKHWNDGSYTKMVAIFPLNEILAIYIEDQEEEDGSEKTAEE